MSAESIEFGPIDIGQKAANAIIHNNVVVLLLVALTLIYIAWKYEKRELFLAGFMIAGLYVHLDFWIKADEFYGPENSALSVPAIPSLDFHWNDKSTLTRQDGTPQQGTPGGTCTTTTTPDVGTGVACSVVATLDAKNTRDLKKPVKLVVKAVKADLAGVVNTGTNLLNLARSIKDLIAKGSGPSADDSLADRLLVGMLIYMRMHQSIAFVMLYGMLVINLLLDIPLVSDLFRLEKWFSFVEDMHPYSYAFLGGAIVVPIVLYELDDGGIGFGSSSCVMLVSTIVLATIFWIVFLAL